MTNNLNKGCNASNHPYGSGEEQSVQEYMTQPEDTYDGKSMTQMIYLLEEKDRMINYLKTRLAFLEAREDVRMGQLKDWRFHGE